MLDNTFQSILTAIVKESQSRSLKTTKTHVLKLIYLVEVEFFREHRRRLTDVVWVYYKYGPYVFNFDEYFDGKCLSITTPFEDFSAISLNDFCDVGEIESNAKRVIKKIVTKYGDCSLNQLLDIVYYDTEPMMNVDKRLDKLDFSNIQTCIKLKNDIIVADAALTNSVRNAKDRYKNATRL